MAFFDLLSPEHHQDSRKRYRRKLNGEPLPGLYEVSIIRKDGRKIPVELTSALTLYNNKPANVVYLRDITQRKEMEARVISERNMARNYLEVANVLIIAIDRDHKVSLINRKGCKLLGYPPEKIIGLKWCDNFLPLRYRETITTLFDGLFRGDTKHYEYFENPVLTSTGEERVVAWHNAIVLDKDNNINTVLCSGNDITELRQAETELYKYHHYLEEIIKERTAQLEEQVLQRTKTEEQLIKALEEESKLRHNLEKQIQQNAEFMRMIAHEMKTPLTSLLASSDLLVENYRTEAAGKLVKQVNKGALDLEKRVNDLFDLARGEIGMLQLNRNEKNPVKIHSGTNE
jgi:PAS domain S-box-containing protein